MAVVSCMGGRGQGRGDCWKDAEARASVFFTCVQDHADVLRHSEIAHGVMADCLVGDDQVGAHFRWSGHV